eukprot:jgi/Botrbrau1/5619/Bobra.55_1s0008.1
MGVFSLSKLGMAKLMTQEWFQQLHWHAAYTNSGALDGSLEAWRPVSLQCKSGTPSTLQCTTAHWKRFEGLRPCAFNHPHGQTGTTGERSHSLGWESLTEVKGQSSSSSVR